MRVIRSVEPVGQVRRYGRPSSPIPSDSPLSTSTGRAKLVRAETWIAGFYDGRLVGVVRERGLVSQLAAGGVVMFAFHEQPGTTLVRWDLASDTFEPLAQLAHRISTLGCNDDATRIGAVAGERTMMFDANGMLLWERADERVGHRHRFDNLLVEGDSISLYYEYDGDDYPTEFSHVRVTADGATWETSRTRPATWHRSVPGYKEYGAVALGMVAVSHDGTRIATVRNAWTRPDGQALAVPELYDSGMSSSWGGEASVHSLVFDGNNELLRACYRGSVRFVERCFAGGSTSLSTYTKLLPWTDLVITHDEDTVRLGGRVLAKAGQAARIHVAFDGSAIAVERRDSASIFDGEGTLLHDVVVPSGGVSGVAPNGTMVACHHVGGFTLVKPGSNDKPLLVLADTQPAFSPDGATVAYGYDWRLYLRDVATDHGVRTDELTSPVTGVCYGRDGKIFSELADGTVIEWSLQAPGPK